jgi:four helix bundle protein
LAGNTEREVLSSEWESENSELRTYNSKLGEAGDSALRTLIEELDMQQRRSQSIVQEKSFHFAVQLVNYSRRLRKDSTDLVLTRQLLRSGTSIGANIEEALGGQSSKDFISKLAIAAKEARETGYWLRLLRETQPHDQQELADLLKECDGLLRMLNSIILTTRRKIMTRENSELRTQNSEPVIAVNSEPRTQNSKLPSS